MNWKEHANLFANGKFEVRSELPSMPVAEVECILHGYTNGQYRLQFSGIFDWVDVADCQLIARPIEDMTDEEIREVCNRENWDKSQCQAMREHLIQISSDRTMPFETAIELLDREIYPFSDTEDVIFKPKQEAV